MEIENLVRRDTFHEENPTTSKFIVHESEEYLDEEAKLMFDSICAFCDNGNLCLFCWNRWSRNGSNSVYFTKTSSGAGGRGGAGGAGGRGGVGDGGGVGVAGGSRGGRVGGGRGRGGGQSGGGGHPS